MEAARANGGGRKADPRVIRTVRRDGREPMGLGAAIGALVTERAWELPAAGATLCERWAAIAPEFAGHVAAVSYDADSGRPGSRARPELAQASDTLGTVAGPAPAGLQRLPPEECLKEAFRDMCWARSSTSFAGG